MSVSQPAAEDTSNNPASNVSDSDEDETENPENTGPSPDATPAEDQTQQDGGNANSQSDSASSPVTAKSLEECTENGAYGEQQGKDHDEEQAVPVSDDEAEAEPEQQYDYSQQYGYDQQQQYVYDNNAIAPIPTEELDEISIAKEISNYMLVNKVNIGELDDVQEMWGLCDAISAAHSGLPDSLLKEAFNLVLEGFYGHAQRSSWMRNHLDHLIRMWKREMLKEKPTQRPTKFVSASAAPTSDIPPAQNMEDGFEQPEQQHEDDEAKKAAPKPTDAEQQQQQQGQPMGNESFAKLRRQRKQAAKRKKALTVIMGVGQMLGHARRKFATEEGELDIEEDPYGNFTIGGMELSFENWGQLNKIQADDVVAVSVQQPAQKRWKSSQNGTTPMVVTQTVAKLSAHAPHPPNFSLGTPPQQQKQPKSSMAEQYPTVNEVEMPVEQQTQAPPKTTVNKKAAKKLAKEQAKLARQEKDEGEISSSDSDNPTSSSEDESSSQPKQTTKKKPTPAIQMNAQERRKTKREEERQQGAASAQTLQALMKKCYSLRGRIVRKLTVQQKAMFMDLMKQSMAGTLQPHAQQQQHQAMAQLLGSFGGGQ